MRVVLEAGAEAEGSAARQQLDRHVGSFMTVIRALNPNITGPRKAVLRWYNDKSHVRMRACSLSCHLSGLTITV